MEIREYYGKEVLQCKKLDVALFRCGNPHLAEEEKYAELLERQEQSRDPDFVRLGAFDGERLCASITSNPFVVNVDGREIKMSGIGGVVADFNQPQKGLVKALFQKGFEIMREKGQIVSHLYPFQADYYRQYGYEVCCKHRRWRIPIEYIRNDDLGQYVYYDGSEKMQQEIREIYRVFSKRYNLSVVKSEKSWERFFQSVLPYAGEHFSYLHYCNGVADAFMSYQPAEHQDRPQDFVVDHLWFTDYRGMRGILAYFVTQRPYGDLVVIETPSHVDLSACNEFQGGWAKRNTVCEVCFDGTTRVVDVEKMLEGAHYRGSGSVCIQIEDDRYCPWNNDCFMVSFGEHTIVSRGGEPDIILNINAFSAMILGAVDLEDALIFSGVRIMGRTEELEKVFYRKHQFIDVHF